VIVTINNLLNALIEDKLSLENLITPELSERLKESMISRGYLYSVNTEEIEFDKEIQNLFDILLYKIFKLYFVETEKRWIEISKQMKEKITKYREISEIILKLKFKNIENIDEINSILLDKNISEGKIYFT